ncbi:MAG: hypothetical protein K0U54_09275 [Bacteroidetes bacterium]|nr:hypothetical protein [Bacteroidota bacterium]
MKKISFITTALLLFICTSCGNFGSDGPENLEASQFKTEAALGMYEVDIPKYMKRATDLNTDASMQYQNIFKETYLAIIDEDKADFIDVFKELGQYEDGLSVAGNYRKVQMDYFTETMQIISESEPKQVTINGNKAEQVELRAKVPDVDYDIYYVLTFIDGRENVYMMMSWTLLEYEKKFSETFLYMADSFKEL